LAAVKDHLFHPLIFPVPLTLELVPLESSAGEIRLPHCSINYFPLEHPGGSIGMLIEAQGKRIAYVTDTTPQRDAQTLQRLSNVDLLMHECYFSDNYQELSLKTGHSWIGAVTEIVEHTKPKRTLLIHVNPLAEVLNQRIVLTDQHRQLAMQFAEDEMIVEI
jgi:ribonuclease BN (tRNA processing enzyme)